jgi:hypothetical protein
MSYKLRFAIIVQSLVLIIVLPIGYLDNSFIISDISRSTPENAIGSIIYEFGGVPIVSRTTNISGTTGSLLLTSMNEPINQRSASSVARQDLAKLWQMIVIKIGINNKDIPREYDTAIIRGLRDELMSLINEEKEIKIKRYGGGWFSRKRMGWDFYRGAFDYMAISRKTYDSDGFQEAIRKHKDKLAVRIIHSLELNPDDKDALGVVLLMKLPPEKLIGV